MKNFLIGLLLLANVTAFAQSRIFNGMKKDEIIIRMHDYDYMGETPKSFTDSLGVTSHSSVLKYKHKTMNLYFEYWIVDGRCLSTTAAVPDTEKYEFMEIVTNTMETEWFLGKDNTIIWMGKYMWAGGSSKYGRFEVLFLKM